MGGPCWGKRSSSSTKGLTRWCTVRGPWGDLRRTWPMPWPRVRWAGPATSALRALTRASGPETQAALAARDAAARIAWSFRKLFNLPEATALIRGERPKDDKTPYWRQVVDYCAAGNLQAVLDEYIHTLRDLEGLFAADDEKAWKRLAGAVSAALSLRTGVPRVDEFRRADDTRADQASPHAQPLRHALRGPGE